MNYEERAFRFDCDGASLIGIASLPERPSPRGVLIVVGGPQYRTGSHRQFTLLARSLAAKGTPAMRFDYRGMGDSEGEAREFEDIERDIRCAVDRFFSIAPGLREVVLWGLCDAASAASFYAWRDERVAGLVLVNPWIRTEAGIAKAYLKHYYVRRLFEPELWKKIASGGFGFREAARSMLDSLRKAGGSAKSDAGEASSVGSVAPASLPDRMLEGLERFKGRLLVLLAGNDLTAAEFRTLAKSSRSWKKLLAADKVCRHEVPQANHTFARQAWRDEVADRTREWLHSW